MGFAENLAAADRSVRTLLGDSEAITFTPGTGSPAQVTGIFDAAYQRVDPVGQAGISTVGPAVFLSLSDLPSDPSADLSATITRGKTGITYKPWQVEPDGMGGVLLHLHQV